MQFGRVVGIALITLGIVLLCLQAALYFAPKSVNPNQPSNRSTQSTNHHHQISFLPGIVGAGSLAFGIALHVTRRRRDEPEQKYAGK